MRFIDQVENEEGKAGTYFLTIGIVFLSIVFGQLISDFICIQSYGHSLLNIPENANLNSILILLLLPFALVFGLLLVSVKYFHKRKIRSVFTSRPKFDWSRFFTSFFIWGGIMLIFLVGTILAGYDIRWNFNSSTFVPLLLISLILIPIQTTAEELIFRGVLLQGFQRLFKKPIVSILISSILFGLLHGANPEVAKLGYGLLTFYILTGVFLALLTHLDDGIELGAGYHAINNIFAAVVLTNDWQAFHTDALFMDYSEPVFGWESILTLIIIQPLLFIIFSKIYKWKNWKQKLLK